jgi:SecD/SecF fusion protein
VPAIGVIVVVLVAVVFLSLRGGGSPGSSAASARGAVELVYVAGPTPQVPVVTSAALERTVELMRARVTALGLRGASVQTLGANQIAVKLPDVKGQRLAESLVGTTVQLEFYDWEANVLTPNGKTVASQLKARDATALQISQGASSTAPGEPNAGSMPLYQAVMLASKQPKSVSSQNARLGPQYYMFGAPGSTACAAKARQHGITAAPGQHCLLAGPDNELYSTSYHRAAQNLASQLPPGASPADGRVLVIQQGTVVLQAANPTAQQTTFSSAQFYVLRDNVALQTTEITNPRRSTSSAGAPAVTFDLNAAGRSAVRNVTAAIARRGQEVSTVGQTFNQHFAVALDNQLITVPSIDFKTYPDGISGDSGADITGGLTINAAKRLANELRLGALPVQLRLINETRMPPAAHNRP